MVVAAGEGAPTCWQGEGAGCELWLVEVYSDGSTGAVERLPFGATAENGPAITPRLDRGGGQFAGTSGPDGMGIALRSLCGVLDGAGIAYHLRDFDDLLAARGLG